MNHTKQGNNATNRPLYHHRLYFCITNFNYFGYCFYKIMPVMQHDKTLYIETFVPKGNLYVLILYFIQIVWPDDDLLLGRNMLH
jgi:hypothetical protein